MMMRTSPPFSLLGAPTDPSILLSLARSLLVFRTLRHLSFFLHNYSTLPSRPHSFLSSSSTVVAHRGSSLSSTMKAKKRNDRPALLVACPQPTTTSFSTRGDERRWRRFSRSS